MANVAEYNCRFGPDVNGQFSEDIVESGIAQNCGNFCACFGFKNNKCAYGPDVDGNYIMETGVSSETVDSCSRAWCNCDTHADIFRQMKASDLTFEEVIEGIAGRPVEFATDPDPQTSGEVDTGQPSGGGSTDSGGNVPETTIVEPFSATSTEESNQNTTFTFLGALILFLGVSVVVASYFYFKKKVVKLDKKDDHFD